MVVKTLWPGATTTDTLQQVTDRIEKKLEELPHLDYVRSYTKPGESVVFVNLKDTRARAAEVPDLWYQVRKKIDDIRQHAAVRHLRARTSTTSSATPIRSSTR